MLDLLAYVPFDDVGTFLSARAAALVRGLVQETSQVSSGTVLSANATFVLLGFLIGLCTEIRKPD